MKNLIKIFLSFTLFSVFVEQNVVHAQDERASVLIEEVITTARKKEESEQEVPLAVTALSSEQLEVQKVRNITELVSVPNVSLDDIGTQRGVPNFQIRGLGHNSSIASIESPVAMIVDGVYVGNGTVMDSFDLASVEILRGPQGTIIGKNAIGGAVLLNSKNPGDEWESQVRLAMDGFGSPGATNSMMQFASGGPVSDIIKVRGVLYINDNQGWFNNSFDNTHHGAHENTMFRGTVVADPTDSLNINVKYSTQETSGDGVSSQCFSLVPTDLQCFGLIQDRDSFDLSINEKGFIEQDTETLTIKAVQDVMLGDGQITYLYGSNTTESEAMGDIDGTRLFIFHAPAKTQDESSTYEIRFNGSFGNMDLLAGYYSYTRDLTYHEMRILPNTLGGTEWNGGGDLSVDSTAFFATAEFPIGDNLVLDLGIRSTEEDKNVSVASLSAGAAALAAGILDAPRNIYFLAGRDPSLIQRTSDASCQIFLGGCVRDFIDNDSWSSTSPRIGLTYFPDDNTTIYGYVADGYRSGGYNMRNTAILQLTPDKGPGPFDQEKLQTLEVGMKRILNNGRLNLAFFSSELTDMQRTLNEAGPAGPVQYIKNTGDATISGFEADVVLLLQNDFVFNASLGTLDAGYDEVVYDISQDGVVDSVDLNLMLPRAADLTYSLGLSRDFMVANWSASARFAYSYRDEVAYSDNNLGMIGEQNILDLGVDFYSPSENFSFGFYGKNLNDSVKHGNVSPVSWGSFSPLMPGKIIGVEAVLSF